MAKKAKAAKVVTVADLAEEFGVEGRKIRVLIRGLGLKAPAVEGQEGFGPRAKYEWASNSKELAKIKKAITEAATAEASAPAKKKGRKSKAKAAEADDEDEDDEDDDDDDEDDDE